MVGRRHYVLSIVSVCILLVTSASYAGAQARFEVSSHERIEAIPGLTVYTLRDSHLGACFVLFVLDAPSFELPATSRLDPLADEPLSTTEQARGTGVVRVLTEAADARDKELEALRLRRDTLWTAQYDAEVARIQDEYDRAVRSVFPELYPPDQAVPAMRTTGADAVNAAVARAFAEADAAAAAADRARIARQLSSVINRLRDMQRLAATGPMACEAGADRRGR